MTDEELLEALIAKSEEANKLHVELLRRLIGDAVSPTPTPPPIPSTFTVRRSHAIGEGGGFVNSIAFGSNFMVCDTDVFNGCIRYAGDDEWQNLLRSDNLAEDQWNPRPDNRAAITKEDRRGANNGTYQTWVAPDDTIYTAWNGQLYRNDGDGFVPTILPPKAFLSDGPGISRYFTRAIESNPNNPAEVLVGTHNDGCYYSRDGFRKHVLELPLPPTVKDIQGTPAPYLVAWGQDGSAYVHVFGTGTYHAPDGPDGEWSLLGGPKHVSCLKVCPTTGHVFACEMRTDRNHVIDALWLFDGEWSQVPGSKNAFQFAVDPNDPTHWVWTNENGGWWRQRGGERIWNEVNFYAGDGEAAWLSNRARKIYVGCIEFDPVISERIWITEGTGVSYSDLAADPVMHDMSNGISELITTCGLSAPSNPVMLVGCLDKPIWLSENGHYTGWRYPNQTKPDAGYGHCTSLDYAADDPQWIAAVCYGGTGNAMSGWSENGGQSWQVLPPPPGQDRWVQGGDLAVSTKGNILIAEGNNGKVWGIKDGRHFPVSLTGEAQEEKAINAYYTLRDCLTADKTRPGTFAFLHNNAFENGRDENGNWIPNPHSGIWVNHEGGEGPWEHTFKGVIGTVPGTHTAQYWQARLAYVPGFTGELLYSAYTGHADGAKHLYWLKDDGREIVELPPLKLRSFDMGMPAEEGGRPSVWFWGTVGEVVGWYVTFDWFETFQLITERPVNSIGEVSLSAMMADRNSHRCLIGMSGNGLVEAVAQ